MLMPYSTSYTPSSMNRRAPKYSCVTALRIWMPVVVSPSRPDTVSRKATLPLARTMYSADSTTTGPSGSTVSFNEHSAPA